MKRYTPWSVLTLLLLSITLVGCEGESPTIPTTTQPPIGGPAPSGQVEVALVASNPNPLVNSTSTITATVTIGGQPAPAGTAVEFSTNLGAFTESSAQTALRITGPNGVATVTLTSTIAGTATVGARVANVFRTINVTFRVETTPPPPDDTTPAITSISPTTGTPGGGQLVTITGTNFNQPVRVLFGDRVATVLSVTPTQIQVATPAIDLGGTEQRRAVDVRVITQAGTPEEKSATSPTQFTYELAVLTPNLVHVSPASGPNEGNTRITIFGEGFQGPIRAFFGTGGGPGPLTDQVELEVLQVFFDRIIAMTPPALGLGSSLRDQQVTLRVLNTLTNQEDTLAAAFRYGPLMQITTVEPLSGTALGGTRVTINGWGFDDPVLVTVAGVRAQPISVDGSRIVVVTNALLSPCESTTGGIIVTNVEDGATDEFGDDSNETGFSYIGTQPSIISVAPNPALPGQAVTIGVRNAGAGTIRFQIGGSTLLPTPPSATNPQGDSNFVVTVPTNISFTTESCTDTLGRAGVRSLPTVLSIVFTNITTGCTDTLDGGLTVNPTDLSCRVPPDAVLNPQTITFTGTCGGPSQVVAIDVSNVGGSNLDINGISSGLAGFQIVSGTFPTTVAPAAPAAQFQVQISALPAALPGPLAPPPQTGTITVATNDPTPPPAIQATVTCTP